MDSSITLQLRNSKGVLAPVTSGGAFNPYRLYVRHDATNSASIGYLRLGDTMELKLPFRWTSTPKFGDLWSQPYFPREARMLQTLDYATINLPENRMFEHDEVEVTCKHEGIGKTLTKTIRAEYLNSDRRAMRLDLKQLFDENYPMRGGSYNPETGLTNRGL